MPPKKTNHILFAIFLASFVSQTLAVAAATATLKTPYIFTDAVARINLSNKVESVPCHVSTITVDGFGPRKTMLLEAKDGKGSITPLAEGIHIVNLGKPINKELRFLAIAPPPKLNKAAVNKALPHNGKKLLSGKPFTILSMGDSVTRTGDYESMLVMLLKRATGNSQISFVDKSYPGRSVDAAVRHFERDTRTIKPDLGLLMYGLNDQACFVPLRAYLEQYKWVAEKMDTRFKADTIFLQPTPHIKIFDVKALGKGNPPEYAFRTIGYAAAVSKLGKQLDVPIADTFSSIWGRGAETLAESAMAMWPQYPRHHRKPFTSILDSRGRGDTIHPNALGHLQIAKAVLATLNGQKSSEPLKITGESHWSEQGVISRITATKTSDQSREGRLEAYAPRGAKITSSGPVSYSLDPGQSISFEVAWPEVRTPEDLLKFPYGLYLNQEFNHLSVVDFADKSSKVHSVEVAFKGDTRFVPERLRVDDRLVKVKLQTSEGTEQIEVKIPEGKQVGRIPLLGKLQSKGRGAHAVSELVFFEYGQALTGEAVIDGELDEWTPHRWSPVGEACQARGGGGPCDYRKSLDEAHIEMAFKIGEKGMYIALRGKGELSQDRAIVFFDPRPQKQLGTVGPYYWAGLSFNKNGRVKIRKGETSTAAPGLTGGWKKTAAGINAELFIPYALMDQEAWPKSGGLGFSMVWQHRHDDGKTTKLMWSENGHEWNPRWYGVVRSVADPKTEMPFMVKIR